MEAVTPFPWYFEVLAVAYFLLSGAATALLGYLVLDGRIPSQKWIAAFVRQGIRDELPKLKGEIARATRKAFAKKDAFCSLEMYGHETAPDETSARNVLRGWACGDCVHLQSIREEFRGENGFLIPGIGARCEKRMVHEFWPAKPVTHCSEQRTHIEQAVGYATLKG